jgi:hypothetical protein
VSFWWFLGAQVSKIDFRVVPPPPNDATTSYLHQYKIAHAYCFIKALGASQTLYFGFFGAKLADVKIVIVVGLEVNSPS